MASTGDVVRTQGHRLAREGWEGAMTMIIILLLLDLLFIGVGVWMLSFVFPIDKLTYAVSGMYLLIKGLEKR